MMRFHGIRWCGVEQHTVLRGNFGPNRTVRSGNVMKNLCRAAAPCCCMHAPDSKVNYKDRHQDGDEWRRRVRDHHKALGERCEHAGKP
jgi:hypothetical protein